MNRIGLGLAPAVLFLAPLGAGAQVPVDAGGNPVGDYESYSTESAGATGNEGIPLLSQGELQDLVGPIALYPDDLLAIVLPAATYPLQIVQAARFLEDLESNPSLKPDENWDDSIIALINYPDVVQLLNEDLDWTWQLGEAVVAQQADVVGAVESFRDQAYAAGNLASDSHQTVSQNDGIIEITPVSEEVIYVPYYEPAEVIVYQPRPVYHYYSNPCPVYYYPYSNYNSFNRGYFWGVTTAFSIGWRSDRLRVYHHSFPGHPYYGRSYRDRYWYRRPDISVYNSIYVNNYHRSANNRYTRGDYWRPSRRSQLRYSDQRITRSNDYPNRDRRTTRSTRNTVASNHFAANRSTTTQSNRQRSNRQQSDRQRSSGSVGTTTRQSSGSTQRRRNDASNQRSGETWQQRTIRREGNTSTQRNRTNRDQVQTTTRQRQSTNRSQQQTTQRREQPTTQRQTTQRQQRQTTQRQTTQRQQRQTTTRQQPQRAPTRERSSNRDSSGSSSNQSTRQPAQNESRRSESRRSESSGRSQRSEGRRRPR